MPNSRSSCQIFLTKFSPTSSKTYMRHVPSFMSHRVCDDHFWYLLVTERLGTGRSMVKNGHDPHYFMCKTSASASTDGCANSHLSPLAPFLVANENGQPRKSVRWMVELKEKILDQLTGSTQPLVLTLEIIHPRRKASNSQLVSCMQTTPCLITMMMMRIFRPSHLLARDPPGTMAWKTKVVEVPMESPLLVH